VRVPWGQSSRLHGQAEWEALEDRERARYGYEVDLKKYLDRLMVDLKAKIKKNEERLAAVEKPLLLPDDAVQPFRWSTSSVFNYVNAELQAEWLL
jgi:hypothetical protein